MKNINWKLRFQNKITLTAIVLALIAIVYQILSLFGVTPTVSQDEIVNIALMIINMLVLVGVVVDPTTEGMQDSERAMTYEHPYAKEDDKYAE